MSSSVVMQATGLTKSYPVYDKPSHRFFQMFFRKRKLYSDFVALRDVSFVVRKGESLGIIGRNGSGKSTLLQLVSGTLNPTAGDLQVTGRIAALLELGSGFNPEFTGRENIYMNAALLGLSEAAVNDRLEDIIAFADIGEYLDLPVKTYSSGMFVRLAFAVQAHVEPEILIVDEALSVGDMFFQQKCIMFMRDKLKDCTKILVSHDLQAIMQHCDRVLVMDRGSICFDGPVKQGVEVYLRQSHTAEFSGAKSVSVSQVRKKEEQSQFNRVLPENLGGKLGVSITGVRACINSLSCEGQEAVVQSGDQVKITFLAEARHTLEDLILGYLITDRNGQSIFGDNSVSLDRVFEAKPGDVLTANLAFVWPDIAPGKYTLTLGVGRGRDPLKHVIECWAHSIFMFDYLNEKPVHGLFTNSLQDVWLDE